MKKTSMIIAAIAIMTLGGCTKTSNTVQYNEESWKTMVPSTCTSFFDGCNTCNRMENGTEAACTRMYCETYQEPKCLSTMHPSRDLDNNGINDCEEDGTCDDSIDYTQPKENTTKYDQESRKTTISENCQSFFDGCNNCNKMEDSENAACTMMYCETYQQPKCLD